MHRSRSTGPLATSCAVTKDAALLGRDGGVAARTPRLRWPAMTISDDRVTPPVQGGLRPRDTAVDASPQLSLERLDAWVAGTALLKALIP